MGFRLLDFLRNCLASESQETIGPENEATVEYMGYTIRPLPRQQGSQWLTAGVITKQFADGVKENEFIRADTHSTKDDADADSLGKAKQIIDELGDKLFQNG